MLFRSYTPEGGTIKLAWERGANDLRFSVSDTGIGIDEQHISRLTERFYRVDKARSRASIGGTGSGAGLGLAIAKWIAGIHGGSVTLVETGPTGSTFRATVARQALT